MPWITINAWKKKHKIGVKKPKPKFKLLGFDSFSSEWYSLGTFQTEVKAKAAAQEKLKENERHQPSSSSGGQSGIQDQVHIERPDGSTYRVFPGV